MKLNIDLKTIIIIVLSIALLICTDGCGFFGSQSGATETTTTTIDTTFVKETSTSTLKDIDSQEVKQAVVIKKNGEVRKVEDDHLLTQEELDIGAELATVKKLNQTISLLNGTVFSETLYSGKILSSEYTLETNTPTLTKTIHTEKTIVSSGTFLYVGTSIGLTGGVRNLQVGVEYIHRNKWLIGTGLSYNTDPFAFLPTHNRIGFDVKLGFKF